MPAAGSWRLWPTSLRRWTTSPWWWGELSARFFGPLFWLSAALFARAYLARAGAWWLRVLDWTRGALAAGAGANPASGRPPREAGCVCKAQRARRPPLNESPPLAPALPAAGWSAPFRPLSSLVRLAQTRCTRRAAGAAACADAVPGTAAARRPLLRRATPAPAPAEWFIHLPLFNVLLGFPIQFLGLIVTP